jgi:hypothetical protein
MTAAPAPTVTTAPVLLGCQGQGPYDFPGCGFGHGDNGYGEVQGLERVVQRERSAQGQMEMGEGRRCHCPGYGQVEPIADGLVEKVDLEGAQPIAGGTDNEFERRFPRTDTEFEGNFF